MTLKNSYAIGFMSILTEMKKMFLESATNTNIPCPGIDTIQ